MACFFMPSVLRLLFIYIWCACACVCMCSTCEMNLWFCFWLFYIIRFSVSFWQVRQFLFGRICFSNYHLIRFVAILLRDSTNIHTERWRVRKRGRVKHYWRWQCKGKKEWKYSPAFGLAAFYVASIKRCAKAKNVNHMLKAIITLIERSALEITMEIYINKTIPNHFSLVTERLRHTCTRTERE